MLYEVITIEGLDVDLSGDMSASQTNLDVKAQIRSLMVSYENVKYLNGVTVDLKSGIGADLDNMIFTFINNDTNVITSYSIHYTKLYE